MGWLEGLPIHAHVTTATGIGSKAASLVETDSPEVFVNSDRFVHSGLVVTEDVSDGTCLHFGGILLRAKLGLHGSRLGLIDDSSVGECGTFLWCRSLGDVATTVNPYLDHYLTFRVGGSIGRRKCACTAASEAEASSSLARGSIVAVAVRVATFLALVARTIGFALAAALFVVIFSTATVEESVLVDFGFLRRFGLSGSRCRIVGLSRGGFI